MTTARERVSKEGLQRLPLRGIVAFAARCARRVQPVFVAWNDGCGSGEQADAVEAAIRLAEDFAKGVRGPAEVNDSMEPVFLAADDASRAADQTSAFEAGNAADTAAHAAHAAVNAADAVGGMTPADKWALAGAAANLAYEAGQRMLLALAGDAKAEALQAAEEDFAALLGLNLGKCPELGQPVSLDTLPRR